MAAYLAKRPGRWFLDSVNWSPFVRVENFIELKSNLLVVEDWEVPSIYFPEGHFHQGESDLTGFWAQARSAIIGSICRKYELQSLIEIGAGSGLMATNLRKMGVSVCAIEPLQKGVEVLANLGVPTIWSDWQSAERHVLPQPALGLFDVIEHVENDADFLSSVSSKLAPGGLLLVTVPQHKWLFSNYDITLGHFRRYSSNSIRDLAQKTGLEIIEKRSIFTFLILPALLRRLSPVFARGSTLMATRHLAPSLNSFLTKLSLFEFRFGLPLGTSMLVVFRKGAAS